MSVSEERWILQLCHGYSGPFLDVARQYAVLFRNTPFKVLTVYLTGEPNEQARAGSASDEVIFLDHSSRSIRGLKIGAIRDVRRIAASRDIALIIAHRFKPIYAACLATRLPILGVHHGYGDYDRPQRRWFARLFQKRLALLGVSDAVRDDIRKRLPDWAAERIETLYNRIDVDAVESGLLPRAAARAALDLPEDAWIVGNVGRLHPDKDQATLIRAFAQAMPNLPPRSLLAIMGSGRLEKTLQALTTSLNLRESVRFLGQVAEGRRYFKAFDIFALSSDHEPFGMVLLEALAAGLPVVCSDCGGGREVVAEIGELFPFGDADALARCLIRFAEQGTSGEAHSKRMETHVRQKFSDTATAATFWRLPMVRTIAGEKQT